MAMEHHSVKHTALHTRHVNLGARMGEFAGFMMPLWYSSIKEEHDAVRNGVGLFDLSHMGEFFINGPQAFDLCQYLTCNDVRRIGDGQCQYTLFPTPEGGTVDDLIVYQQNPESYMMVVNASNIDKDFAWVTKHNRFDCTVENQSDDYSLVAVQGPNTDALLEAFGFKNISAMSQFTWKRTKLHNRSVILCGTGYTGERGFEIIVANEDAGWLWDGLMKVGEQFGVKPIGLGARDTLRLEMAYSLYGNELDDNTSALEAGLPFYVRTGPEFIGVDVLRRQEQEGVTRKVCGLVVTEEKRSAAPRHGAPVYSSEGEDIGEVTSGSFSPSLDKGIALASLKKGYWEPGMHVQIEIRGRRMNAEIVNLPFYRKPKKKSKS
ncbi:MAG: glycine cleavage system aminomethyltransferase GcvT [Planctomycetales bacterium]|nr:glycine cleavage system aminomethyltransferase GcvT [bacterium]UNM07657.1 MAG: glycine cleavage system aminomethyltransferase GcvT [Planctomycetales bacterium]